MMMMILFVNITHNEYTTMTRLVVPRFWERVTPRDFMLALRQERLEQKHPN
jgi:hypothetical protein